MYTVARMKTERTAVAVLMLLALYLRQILTGQLDTNINCFLYFSVFIQAKKQVVQQFQIRTLNNVVFVCFAQLL